jgi:hypothetical protein
VQGCFPGGHEIDLHAGAELEAPSDEAGDIGIVLDNEHANTHSSTVADRHFRCVTRT